MLEAARLRKHLEAALEYCGGTHTLVDVITQIYAGHMQFWPGERSAIVTQIVQHPQKKVLAFFLAGGDGAELREMRGRIERWALKEHGCTCATLTGRRGWARSFMVEEGYTADLVHMTKELRE
jgi:hypothetical protein